MNPQEMARNPELERPTGRAVSLEFRGRTEIIHVRPGRWNRWRVLLGVRFFKWGQGLIGIRVGQGRVCIDGRTAIEL